jgi:integrase/recombinase XerD
MTIQFERRDDRPDAAGRCVIHLWAYFDGQRLRMATAERCLAAEWNEDKGRFRKSISGYQDANDSLEALAERLAKAYRELRTAGVAVTAALLKTALQPKLAAEDLPPAPLTEDLFGEYMEVLRGRGFRIHTLRG